MKIVCLVNGGDGLVAYRHTQIKYPDAEVIAIHFEQELPYEKTLLQFLPNYVIRDKFSKFKDSMNLRLGEDESIHCDDSYEPLVWTCIVKHRADKVVLGVIKGDENLAQNDLSWVSQFNNKLSGEIVEFPLIDMTKKEVLEYAIKLGGCITPALDSISCSCKDPGPCGCGNCIRCLRKKTAIASMGRVSRIPPATKITYYPKQAITLYSEELKNGTPSEYLELLFSEIAPSLSELLGTSDPHEMAERIELELD